MGFCGGHQLTVGFSVDLGVGFGDGLWLVAMGAGWFGLPFSRGLV